MEKFIGHWATIALFGFSDGLAFWLLQHFAFHLNFTYWQCFWTGFVVAFVLKGTINQVSLNKDESNA